MQHLGIISFIPFWVFVIYVLNKKPKLIYRTLSKRAAANKTMYLLYAFEISYSAITYLLLNQFWYFNYHHAEAVFKVIIYCVVMLQLTFAWVADSQGIASVIHNIAAYMWGFLLYLSFVILLFSEPLSLSSKTLLTIGLLLMSVISLIIIKNRALNKNLLVYQLVYIGTVHAIIIITSYTS